MAEKVTVMVLKVDLQCPCCYKKVKKILCKYPQIRDQKYNEKANTVTITVVCCSPEKFRDKLCCKGAKVIKSIEFIEKPPPPRRQRRPPPPPPPPPPKRTCCRPCNEGYRWGPCYHGSGVLQPPHPPSPPPKRTCCRPCYEVYGGGPCYHGYGVPPPPPPCHDGCYGYGYGYDWAPRHVSKCGNCITEEKPPACSIM